MRKIEEKDIITWAGTIEDLKKQKYKRDQKIRFFCEECGEENISNFNWIRRKNDRFLCRKCKLRESLIKEYGSMEEYARVSKERQDKTNLERYGTTNPNDLPEIKQKIKNTTKERWGNENSNLVPEIREKMRQTSLKNYGVDHPNKSQVVKDKIKKTNQERYGVDCYTQTAEYREKTIATNRVKYGVDWTHQNREIIEKGIQTTRERYGVDNVSQSPEIQAKKIQTCQAHYGVDFPFQSEEVKETAKRNNLEKWGVEFPQTLDEVKEKQAQTNLEKYGTVSTAQAHYSEKTREVLFDKDNFLNFIMNEAEGSIARASILLAVEDSTIRSYVSKYGLEEEILYKTSRSCYEIEIKDFLDSLNIKYSCSRRDIISPLELDIFLDDLNIAIEFNGNYWHSDLKKDTLYHSNKSSLCEEKGIRLIHIYEYEWKNYKEKILNYIKDLISPKIKIGARKCKVKELSVREAKDFLEKYHLQGYASSSIRVGLYYNEELMEIMSFSKSRFSKNYEYEISRLASKSGYEITGGASKIFKYFEKNYKPKNIITYCDRDKFTGKVYENLGFIKKETTQPGYLWINSQKNLALSRYQCTRKVLEKRGFFGTEDEVMRSLGFLKIYNSGNFVFVKEYN